MNLIVEWHLNTLGDVCFAHINGNLNLVDKESLRIFDSYTVCRGLPYNIPYQVGDIITVDCRPKLEISHAVIAEIGNQSDCCGVQVVYLYEGKFDVSPLSYCLEHPARFPRYYVFPGFHRLTKFAGDLSLHKDAILMKISKALKENPSLGKNGNIQRYLEEFSLNLTNFLPSDIVVGDVIQASDLCHTCESYPRTIAVVADMPDDVDDVVIIYTDELKVFKTTLKSRFGAVAKLSFEKITQNDSEPIPYLLRQVSKELLQNPALIHDEEYLQKLSALDNSPYVPEGYEKYNLLPGCSKRGGDIHIHPSEMRDTINSLLPEDSDGIPYPYFHSFGEYDEYIDELIAEHGLTNGATNELGKVMHEYKALVKEMNNKDKWSVLKYIGESYDNIRAFGGFTHGMYYYMTVYTIDGDTYYGIIDDEEYSSSGWCPDKEKWEIAEDPTGIAAKALAQGYEARKRKGRSNKTKCDEGHQKVSNED